MGYGEEQLADLAATIRAVPCDAVIIGTPVDLGRIVSLGHPVRPATYALDEIGPLTLSDVLAPHLAAWRAGAGASWRRHESSEPPRTGNAAGVDGLMIEVWLRPRDWAASRPAPPAPPSP
jgi:hypothetical protein